jgi:hypothetical protein
MVRIAKKDTYGMEPVAGGVEVRRRVVAGQPIPDDYVLDEGAEYDEVVIAAGSVRVYAPEQVTQRADVERGVGKGASIHTVEHDTEEPPRSPAERGGERSAEREPQPRSRHRKRDDDS